MAAQGGGQGDKEGNAIAREWIKAESDTIDLPAGESIDLQFRCSVPVDLPTEIVDGLDVWRLDLLEVLARSRPVSFRSIGRRGLDIRCIIDHDQTVFVWHGS